MERKKEWEERNGKNTNWLFHTFVWEMGLKVGNAGTCAHLCVDNSRDMDSGGGTKLGCPVYFVVGPYNCNTNVML